MADNTAGIQQLYVAYFNRPADYSGLQYWNDQINSGKATLATVAAAFSQQTEYTDTFKGMSNAQIIAQVYLNLFGKTLDKIDTAGFDFWLKQLNNKVLTIDNVVTGIAAGAQGADLTALNDKVAAATTFTAGLDTAVKQTGYSTVYANGLAKAWLSTITDDASLKAAVDPTALAKTITTVTTPYTPPMNLSLTTGIDNLMGGAGNDVFNAIIGTGATLGTFDSIDGVAGMDTLNINDVGTAVGATTIPTNVTIKNIEVLNVQSAENAGVTLDTSSMAGMTAVTVSAAGAAAPATVTVAGTTAVTVSATGTANVTAGTGAATVSAGSTATVTGGSTQTVSSTGGAILTKATGAIVESDSALAAGSISATGGTSVTVTAKGVTTGTVTVGSATAAPTGAVSVTTTNAAATSASSAEGAINVTGGTTVAVTENLVAPTVTSGNPAYTETGGAVTVNGTSATTSVSVTQTAAVAAVGALAQVDTVTVGGTVATGDVFKVNVGTATYTYTAVAGDTTASVAAALAGQVTAASGATAAVAGSVITLTAAAAGTAFTATTAVTSAAATEAVAVTTANKAAAGGIVDGQVQVIDANSANTDSTKANTITTVSLDGYGAGSKVMTNALSSLSLANSAADVTVTDNSAKATATTLALSVNNLSTGATLTDNAITTLNITTGAKASALAVNAAADTKVTVAGSGDVSLNLTNVTKLASFDGSAATGAITLTGLATTATSVMTGAGADTVTLTTATAAAVAATTTAAAVPAVNATLGTGAGNDTITVATTGTGATSVDAGAGNDNVNIMTRGTGVLTVSLGDGNDTFNSAVAVNSTDVIDGGAGTDTLLLSLVGSANIGSFSNFEVFDAKAMGHTLDVDILASKNAVTEFVASGDVGAGAALINIGSGVNFRATGDMGTTNTLSLTQKTAGALTVTLDADTTSTTAAQAPKMDVTAVNATSMTAVFGEDSANTTAGANVGTIILQADNATSLSIVSGGTNASNVFNFVNAGKLASVTISGASNLDLAGTNNHMYAVTSVDASALTGKLSIDLANLKAGAASVTLGSAADTVYASAAASNTGAFDALVGFQKASATAVSTTAAAADVTKAIAAADQLVVTGAMIEANNTTTNVKNGVLSFTGAGPSTLAAAVSLADAAATATGHAVEFEYLGNSYVFVQGDAAGGAVTTNDIVVKLTGVTGVTNFVENGTTDHFFLV